MDDPWTQSMWRPWTIRMDSIKIIKIMVICGLSVDSPWTEKLNLGVATAKKNSMESMEHPWSLQIHVDSTRITWGSDKSSYRDGLGLSDPSPTCAHEVGSQTGSHDHVIPS